MSSNRTPTSSRGPIRRRRIAMGIAPIAVVALGAAAILASSSGAAQATVPLGTAGSFAVLAGAGITNTGATTITGDVGSFATTSESGFNTVTLTGASANHAGDAVTQQAKNDLTTGYNTAAGATPTSRPVELGGATLTPGIYRAGTFGNSGTLTLDTQGNP